MSKMPLACQHFLELTEKHRRLAPPPVLSVIFQPKFTEGFEVFLEENGLRLTYSDARTGICAFEQMRVACLGGQMRGRLGSFQAQFAARWLWLKPSKKIIVGEGVGIGLPESLVNPHKTCLRALELGFNGIIIGDDGLSPCERLSSPEINLSEILEVITGYGLKVFLKPSYKGAEFKKQPLPEKIQQVIGPLKPFFSMEVGLFWECQGYQEGEAHDSKGQIQTQYERIQHELNLVEDTVQPSSLCFALLSYANSFQTQEAEWLAELAIDAGKRTYVIFSPVSGMPWQDYRPIHPFWAECRKRDLGEQLPLLPILNIGAMGRGEGLWPTCAMPVLDRFLGKMAQGGLQGAICMTPTLPAAGTFLDGSLWVAGQSLWHGGGAREHFDLWLSLYHPHADAENLTRGLFVVEEVSLLIASLKGYDPQGVRDASSLDKKRTLAEYLLAILNRWSCMIPKEENEDLQPPYPFEAFLAVFLRDARRYVFHFLQQHRISLPYPANEGDLKPGFWTSKGGHGMEKSKSADLHMIPFAGEEGSFLSALYREVYPQ